MYIYTGTFEQLVIQAVSVTAPSEPSALAFLVHYNEHELLNLCAKEVYMCIYMYMYRHIYVYIHMYIYIQMFI
jgi:hypothetical protein